MELAANLIIYTQGPFARRKQMRTVGVSVAERCDAHGMCVFRAVQKTHYRKLDVFLIAHDLSDSSGLFSQANEADVLIYESSETIECFLLVEQEEIEESQACDS